MGFRDSKILNHACTIALEDLLVAGRKIQNLIGYADSAKPLVSFFANCGFEPTMGYIAEAVIAREIFGGHELLEMNTWVGADVVASGIKYDVKFGFTDGERTLTARELSKHDIDYFVFCTTAESIDLENFPKSAAGKKIKYIGSLSLEKAIALDGKILESDLKYGI